MLEMRLYADPAVVTKAADEFSEPYRQNMSAYVAKEGNTNLGICLFEKNTAGIRIIGIDVNEDAYLFDGLVRAAMSTLFGCENDRVEFSDKINQGFLEEFGFCTGKNRIIPSASSFFEVHKNCKK